MAKAISNRAGNLAAAACRALTQTMRRTGLKSFGIACMFRTPDYPKNPIPTRIRHPNRGLVSCPRLPLGARVGSNARSGSRPRRRHLPPPRSRSPVCYARACRPDSSRSTSVQVANRSGQERLARLAGVSEPPQFSRTNETPSTRSRRGIATGGAFLKTLDTTEIDAAADARSVPLRPGATRAR